MNNNKRNKLKIILQKIDVFGDVSVLRKIALSFFLKVAAGLSWILVTLFIARVMDQSDSGVIFLSITSVLVLSSFFLFGGDTVVTRNVSESHSKSDQNEITSTITLFLFMVFLIGGGALTTAFFLKDQLSTFVFHDSKYSLIVVFIFISSILTAMYRVFAHAFQGVDNQLYFNVFKNLSVNSLFLMVALIGCFFWGCGDVFKMSFAYMLAAFLTLVLSVYYWVRKTGGFSFVRLKFNTDVIRQCPPLLGVTLGGLILSWFGQFYLGIIEGTDAVAVYTAALRVSSVVVIVLASVNSVVFPRFAVLSAQGKNGELKAVSIRGTRLIMLMSLPVLIIVLMFSEQFMSLFGADYVFGAMVLKLLVIGQLFNVSAGSLFGLLSMSGYHSLALFSSMFSSGVLIVLCVVLIPRFGMEGAAFSQVFAMVLQLLVNTIWVRKKLGFYPFMIFTKIKK